MLPPLNFAVLGGAPFKFLDVDGGDATFAWSPAFQPSLVQFEDFPFFCARSRLTSVPPFFFLSLGVAVVGRPAAGTVLDAYSDE